MKSGQPIASTKIDVGLVIALPIEWQAFKGRLSPWRSTQGPRLTFYRSDWPSSSDAGQRERTCVRLMVVECGMGSQRAAAATHALIDAHQPTWILSAGFAGGLTTELAKGDLLFVSKISCAGHESIQTGAHTLDSPTHGMRTGPLHTADSIVRDASSKREIFATTAALAVDLESYGVAQVCRERSTRFIGLRVISDSVDETIPLEALSVTGPTGAIRWGATLGALIKRPAAISDLWSLRESALKCATRLADGIEFVLTSLDRDSSSC